jgi:hypothetical protein
MGYIITPRGMKMDVDKVQAIQEWRKPQSLRDIQSFPRICQFLSAIQFWVLKSTSHINGFRKER